MLVQIYRKDGAERLLKLKCKFAADEWQTLSRITSCAARHYFYMYFLFVNRFENRRRSPLAAEKNREYRFKNECPLLAVSSTDRRNTL